MYFRLYLLFVFALVAGGVQPSLTFGQQDILVKIERNKRTYIGKPLVWDGKNMQLLRRDGRMTLLPVASADDYQVISDRFSVLPRINLIAKLKKEFGSQYKISSTPNFLVVHPHGDHQTWAKPFEDLNRRFASYFSTRGHKLAQPDFLMVAVILNTRGEFDRMLKGHYKSSDSSMLGYYSSRSNRIITYDQSEDAEQFVFSTNTLIHEATHQIAFNRGVHNRFGDYSSWAVEGLACMFEAEGVNNSYMHTKRQDRINSGRLLSILIAIKKGKAKGTLEKIVRDDNLFRTDPELAYAYAWGLTFYLAEAKQREYLRFLTDDAERKDFSKYDSTMRIENFAKAFGADFDDLEARMFNFLKKQKVKVPKGYVLKQSALK